jgi:hypothetical protein
MLFAIRFNAMADYYNREVQQAHNPAQGMYGIPNSIQMIIDQAKLAVANNQLYGPPTGPQASTDTAAQAKQLVQTLQQGLGTGNGLQMGSDFVGNLATGMHTQIPTISVASKTIGTNIAQQMIEGAMTQLGVSGGGAGGIGPGSTLADLVKYTVSQALATQNQSVWGDQHTPGGLHGGYGTWGQR